MKTEHYNELTQDFWEHLQSVSSAKGVEYGSKDDRLANFKRIAKQVELDPKRVLMVFASKHWDSINHYVITGEAGTEPIRDRLYDLVNYMCLLNGLNEE